MTDSIDTALDTAWGLLAEGAANRHSPVHTPVLASIDARGHPDSRILVLRAADRATRTLRFHTDLRSPKVAALHGAPVSILAYDAAAAIQLRIAAFAHIETDTPRADAIWAAATAFTRRCYLAEHPPGTVLGGPASGLPAWAEGRAPTEADLVPARANFALIFADVIEIDWLHLASTGHRRARFSACDEWQGEWLAP